MYMYSTCMYSVVFTKMLLTSYTRVLYVHLLHYTATELLCVRSGLYFLSKVPMHHNDIIITIIIGYNNAGVDTNMYMYIVQLHVCLPVLHVPNTIKQVPVNVIGFD